MSLEMNLQKQANNFLKGKNTDNQGKRKFFKRKTHKTRSSNSSVEKTTKRPLKNETDTLKSQGILSYSRLREEPISLFLGKVKEKDGVNLEDKEVYVFRVYNLKKGFFNHLKEEVFFEGEDAFLEAKRKYNTSLKNEKSY